MSKIIDIIKGKPSYSLEITPDISMETLRNLPRNPAFFSVTWHSKVHQCKDLDIPPIKIAKYLRSLHHNVLLHLSCDMLKMDYLIDLLPILQIHDIRNLFVVLGEGYDPSSSDFKSSKDLIQQIKEQSGDYFCIGVAGFPDCNDAKLTHLKEKVETGADFIITQAFFESEVYKRFQQRCTDVDIKVPIIPGIFLFESRENLNYFLNLCKVKVSDDFISYIQDKENDKSIAFEAIKKLAFELKNKTCAFHFFSLNKLDNVFNFINTL